MSKPLAQAENRHRQPVAFAVLAALSLVLLLPAVPARRARSTRIMPVITKPRSSSSTMPLSCSCSASVTPMLPKASMRWSASIPIRSGRAARCLCRPSPTTRPTNMMMRSMRSDRFLALHPGSRDAPYAYYLKAICYYEQISDVGRDQEKHAAGAECACRRSCGVTPRASMRAMRGSRSI